MAASFFVSHGHAPKFCQHFWGWGEILITLEKKQFFFQSRVRLLSSPSFPAPLGPGDRPLINIEQKVGKLLHFIVSLSITSILIPISSASNAPGLPPTDFLENSPKNPPNLAFFLSPHQSFLQRGKNL